MAEIKTKVDKANGAVVRKSVTDEVVPRLKTAVGGELGSALAEGLILLEKEGKVTGDALSALEGGVDTLRTRVAAAVSLSKGAEDKAAEATAVSQAAKADAQDAREVAAHSNTQAEQALGAASEAGQIAQGAVDTAHAAVERVEEVSASTTEALEKAARKTGTDFELVEGRTDELAGKVEELTRAMNTFGRDVDRALGLADKASVDAEHAVELLTTAGDLVKEVNESTQNAVEGAHARIDEVRASLTPAPRPTGDATEEDIILAGMDELKGKGPIAKQALALAQELGSKYADLVTAVSEGFAAIDQKIQLLAMAAGLNDEETKAMEDPSFKLGEKR